MGQSNLSLINQARRHYHSALLKSIYTLNSDGIASNADKGNKLSIRISKQIIESLASEVFENKERSIAQTSGTAFEQLNEQFLLETLVLLEPFRPGKWHIKRLGNRNKTDISDFEQYAHLADLERLSSANAELAAALGNDYMVCPDIIVFREPLSDEELNENNQLVDKVSSLKTMLRKANGGKMILHASVSSKWTIRSDRSQNTRTEALNLIRNRKGHLPHIVAITAEPLPSRLASLTLGTGDIDCVYHSFLYELVDAVSASGEEDAAEMLKIMIEGKRLKDISDLPLDLMV